MPDRDNGRELREYCRVAATEVALWVPLASGALGILGALAGTGITQRATRKREDRRWERERELDQIRHDRERLARQRERRAALYVDLAEYTQNQESSLEVTTDEYGESRDGMPDLQHPDRLTARVRLYAAPEVGESWAALVQAIARVRWEWFEGDIHQNEHHRWLDPGNRAVVELDRAIKEMQATLRVAADEDS
ncbi:hypothetical protein KBX50_24810 [Micromonospora sp. C51]|uniref:hypothetical protein n=1 Tax=Micromonospora sp. C51 TaxID=2824879 RepID=UPI001B37BF6D|nr:hypothetical protein [Micromonospora sp. C51]MBQ1051675.1 hypothetical protein [Micromonospora sp. C51]